MSPPHSSSLSSISCTELWLNAAWWRCFYVVLLFPSDLRTALSPPPQITCHCRPQDTPSILDWPLPQPAYDEVARELEDQSEDQEVNSINKGLGEEATPGLTAVGRSESQSADLFQELQREVEEVNTYFHTQTQVFKHLILN